MIALLYATLPGPSLNLDETEGGIGIPSQVGTPLVVTPMPAPVEGAAPEMAPVVPAPPIFLA